MAPPPDPTEYPSECSRPCPFAIPFLRPNELRADSGEGSLESLEKRLLSPTTDIITVLVRLSFLVKRRRKTPTVAACAKESPHR
eukprot:m.184710 g.184710  ORF g.184710 m.184710 type:complete len:84 (+) comp39332_c1_seq7:338-589(+)